MKKEFTRKELIHQAVKSFRILIKLVEDDVQEEIESGFFAKRAASYSNFLFTSGVLTANEHALLDSILIRSFERAITCCK